MIDYRDSDLYDRLGIRYKREDMEKIFPFLRDLEEKDIRDLDREITETQIRIETSDIEIGRCRVQEGRIGALGALELQEEIPLEELKIHLWYLIKAKESLEKAST